MKRSWIRNIIVATLSVVGIVVGVFVIIGINKCYIESRTTDEYHVLKAAIADAVSSCDSEDAESIKLYRNNSGTYYGCLPNGEEFKISDSRIKSIIDREIKCQETGFDGSLITEMKVSMYMNSLKYESSNIDYYNDDFMMLKTAIAKTYCDESSTYLFGNKFIGVAPYEVNLYKTGGLYTGEINGSKLRIDSPELQEIINNQIDHNNLNTIDDINVCLEYCQEPINRRDPNSECFEYYKVVYESERN